ncbi:MAG TPA: SDR family oxidoreductase [Pseudolabrys sp.]|nr:SDR family oxidoreductase [Pseudolabrys sp.]
MSPVEPVSLITGASAGIGAALAREFARHGHALVLTARREADLNTLADEIAAAGHQRPRVIAADLATREGTERLAEMLGARGLEPAYVVNNAGFGLLGPAARLKRADQLAMIELNMRALTDLTLRFLPSVKRQRGGILNVASVAAFLPAPGMAVYHASKAYVLSLSEALYAELKAEGVRICALCPGPVATGFNARAGLPDDYFPGLLGQSAERVARAGYDGLMRGRRVVVPGAPNRVTTFLPRLFPRSLVLAYMSWRWDRARGG